MTVEFISPSAAPEHDPSRVRRAKDGREVWLPFAECPDYEVSSEGKVRSRFRVLKTSTGKNGYRTFRARTVDWSYKTFNVHDVVAQIFLGERPAGLQVRHLNSDKSDCRVGNLAYGTPKENAADTIEAGNHWPSRASTCLNGHEYEEHDTYRGGRHCRQCARARRDRWKAKQ